MKNILTSICLPLIVFFYIPKQNDYRKNLEYKSYPTENGYVIFSIDPTGKIAGSKTQRLDFYYHDSLAYGHPVTITSEGTKLSLNAPVLLLEASDKQIPFLIFPKENIHIKYVGSDSVQMYVLGNPQRTNELNFFRKLVQKTGNLYYGFKVMPYQRRVNKLTDIHILEKEINEVKNTRLLFLSNFVRQQPVSNEFSKIAVNTIKSTALTDSLLLYYHNRELLNKQKLYQKLIAEKTATVKNIGFMPFQIYYSACTTLVSLSTSNDPDYIINNKSDFSKRFDFVENNFAGATRDFLMSYTINMAFSNALPVSKEYLSKFNILCATEGYRKMINNKLNEKLPVTYSKDGNNLLLVDGKTTLDMQTVIKKHKGKIIILDFWASWCSPCRAEMPYLEKLKKAYKGKGIAFVAISKDSNISSWIKANNEESLGDENSFLLLNADKSPFVKRYNINMIPRYLLIGKDGKVVSDDTPRPSDPKLSELINKNL